eukprot:jgi/Mesvir1/10733/Mv13806-RA.1
MESTGDVAYSRAEEEMDCGVVVEHGSQPVVNQLASYVLPILNEVNCGMRNVLLAYGVAEQSMSPFIDRIDAVSDLSQRLVKFMPPTLNLAMPPCDREVEVMGLACEALGGKRRQGNASGAGRVNTLQGRWWNRVPIPTGQGGRVRRNRLFAIKGTQYVVLSVFKKKYNKWLEVEEALATDDANVHGHVVTKGVLGRWQWKTLARGHGLTSAQVAAALTVEVKASKVETWGDMLSDPIWAD